MRMLPSQTIYPRFHWMTWSVMAEWYRKRFWLMPSFSSQGNNVQNSAHWKTFKKLKDQKTRKIDVYESDHLKYVNESICENLVKWFLFLGLKWPKRLLLLKSISPALLEQITMECDFKNCDKTRPGKCFSEKPSIENSNRRKKTTVHLSLLFKLGNSNNSRTLKSSWSKTGYLERSNGDSLAINFFVLLKTVDLRKTSASHHFLKKTHSLAINFVVLMKTVVLRKTSAS